MSNMRVVYDNALARAATIVASTTAGQLVANNLKSDVKSEVWRSTSTTASLTVSWAIAEPISMVSLPICSLTPTATVRVRCYSLSGDSTAAQDSGLVLAAAGSDYKAYTGLTASPNANTYAYGGGAYATVWFNAGNYQKIIVDIVDTSNTNGYVEASKLVVGSYWECAYNPEYGANIGMSDNTTQERTDAGDLKSDRGIMYKTISVSLACMPQSDRKAMYGIMRANGLYKPMFISVMPQTADMYEEQMFQIYGKLSKTSALVYNSYNQYSSSIEVEEI